MTTSEPTPEQPTLESRATRGAIWVVAGYGGAQVVRLVGNLILTRLLFVEAFGIMALVASVLQGLELFSDVGIGPSLIQNPREDASFVNTAWTMQVLRGLVLTAIAVALAIPLASFYGNPDLLWLLPVVASTSLIAGFQSTRMFTLNRRLDVRRIEVTLLLAQVVGLVVMIVWALVDRSVHALIAGAIATSLTRTVLSHVYLPGERNTFAWEKPAAAELIRFGRWIFVSTVLTFLSGQADRLLFGRLVPLDRLGIYYIGSVIASIPSEALSKLTTQILFPVYAGVVANGGEFRDTFERVRRPLLVLAGWAFAGLVAGGPTAVDLLYDDRYREAGWAVQWLSAAGFVLIVGNTYGAALIASDRTRVPALGSFAKVVAMAVFIPLGFHLGAARGSGLAFPGAVAGFAAAEVVRYLVCMAGCREFGIRGFAVDLRLTVVVAVTAALGAFVEATCRARSIPVVPRAALIALVVSLAWAPLALPLLRERLARRNAAPANAEDAGT